MEGDGESSFAHYALQKLHILPSIFAAMDIDEKAFVIASCDIRVQAEKEEQKKIKSKQKRKK